MVDKGITCCEIGDEGVLKELSEAIEFLKKEREEWSQIMKEINEALRDAGCFNKDG